MGGPSDESRESDEVRPMATTSGVVDPDDLVGREAVRNELCLAVASGGAKVIGDRRMGKTSALRAVQDDLEKAGHTVVRVSGETSNPNLFSERLLQEMRSQRLIQRALPKWEAELGGEVSVNVGVGSARWISRWLR